MNKSLLGFFLIPLLFLVERPLIANELAGLGSVSGSVSADEPFLSARVYLRDANRHVTYMVYTAGGSFQARNVMPGTYEVSAEKTGFSSDAQTVVVATGQSATANLKLTKGGSGAPVVGSRPVDTKAQLETYEKIYPPGPALATIERTCITCHGVNFIPQRSGLDEAGWNALLEVMLTMNDSIWGIENGTPMMPPGAISPEQRAELVAYLAQNFGPGKPVRMVLNEQDLPQDESELAKAMWIEYTVAEPKSPSGENRWIQEPYFDLQGNVWYTERTKGSPAILRLDPRTGEFTSYPTPEPGWSPHGIVVDPLEPETVVWFAGRGFDVARLDPKTGEIKAYGDTSSPMKWGGHTPVFDSKGDLWYTMIAKDQLGKWERATGQVKHWKIPTLGGRPYGVLVDHQDNVWLAEFYTCKVARFNPVTEEFTEFESPSAPCSLRRLGLDSKGTIWYGAFSAGMLGRLDPATGEMKEYKIGRFSEPYEAWADPDDKIWITDGGQGGMLVRFDPDTEKFTYYQSPQRSDMPKMAITREGAVWYSNRSLASSGQGPATVGVLYPDVSRMTTLGAYYAVDAKGRAYGSGSPAPAKP